MYPELTQRNTTFARPFLLTMMLLATLAAPSIEWNTGDDRIDEALVALLGPIATAAAADFESDRSMVPADHVSVIQSDEVGENIRLVDAFDDNDGEVDDWCMGDFFMLNVTNRFSYFAVCWGSESNPGPVTIAALEVQYLGGVNLNDFPVEGMTTPGVPLPVATIFATSLAHMLEFEDTGTPSDPANTSGNGLFDYTRSGEGLTDFDIQSAENVHAAVDLSRLSWTMTDDGVEEWENGSEMGWNFTLEATDVAYNNDGWWLTASGDSVEKIAYTFHLGVEIDEVTNEVIPWWDISLDPNEGAENASENASLEERIPWIITDVGPQQNLTWSGVRVATDFKYDQLVEGWDFHSENSLLMVESVIARGSFTFGLIADFIDDVAGDFDEMMAYDAAAEDEVVLGVEDMRGVNQVSGTNVEWRHNYTKVPDRLHWVDTAEIGDDSNNTTTVNVTFQLHASEAFYERNDLAAGSLYIAIGGAIYPAGNYIFHDPGYAASIDIIQLGNALLSGEVVGLQFVVVGLFGVLAMAAVIRRRRKHRGVLESYSVAQHRLQGATSASVVPTLQGGTAMISTANPATDEVLAISHATSSPNDPGGAMPGSGQNHF